MSNGKYHPPKPTFAWAKPKFVKPPPLPVIEDNVPTAVEMLSEHSGKLLVENEALAKEEAWLKAKVEELTSQNEALQQLNKKLEKELVSAYVPAPTLSIKAHYVGTKETAELHKKLADAVEIMSDVLKLTYCTAGVGFVSGDPYAVKKAVKFLTEANDLLQPEDTSYGHYKEMQQQSYWYAPSVKSINPHLLQHIDKEATKYVDKSTVFIGVDLAADDCSGPNGDQPDSEG